LKAVLVAFAAAALFLAAVLLRVDEPPPKLAPPSSIALKPAATPGPVAVLREPPPVVESPAPEQASTTEQAPAAEPVESALAQAAGPAAVTAVAAAQPRTQEASPARQIFGPTVATQAIKVEPAVMREDDEAQVAEDEEDDATGDDTGITNAGGQQATRRAAQQATRPRNSKSHEHPENHGKYVSFLAHCLRDMNGKGRVVNQIARQNGGAQAELASRLCADGKLASAEVSKTSGNRRAHSGTTVSARGTGT
jgi:hypothetical protein